LVIFTGFYLSYPTIVLISMRTIRYIHLLINAVLAALVIARIYFAYAVGDYRNFSFHRGDRKKFVQLMAYYLFLANEAPYEETKYNVGQRLIYVSWIYAWLMEAITGLVLANPHHGSSVLITAYFGGLQMVRFVHYVLAVYFTVTIIVHIYLATTSDLAKFQAMISGFVRVKNGKPDE
jgi:Ni/Fe-hydrogenase 1 B-type cytochrome subunit